MSFSADVNASQLCHNVLRAAYIMVGVLGSDALTQGLTPPCRGAATGWERRVQRGMQGLLPPRVTSLQAEIDRAHAAIARYCTPLEKYQVCTPFDR